MYSPVHVPVHMPPYKFACKKLICCRDWRETRGDGLLAEDLVVKMVARTLYKRRRGHYKYVMDLMVKMVMAAAMIFGHKNTLQKEKSPF